MLNSEELSSAQWRRSSRSGDASNCVEVVVIDTRLSSTTG
jgi:Domain of unknown function (DUF397)